MKPYGWRNFLKGEKKPPSPQFWSNCTRRGDRRNKLRASRLLPSGSPIIGGGGAI